MESPMESPEELRLSHAMRLAQAGDSVAYRDLLSELSQMLEKYAVAAVKRFSAHTDLGVAKDILQEILLAIHQKRHTYEPSQKLLPWVFGIARHKLIDWQRKHYGERKHLDHARPVRSLA